jgi:anaerobic ribonucleoside-triphosphate reductase activating protein
MNIRVMGFTGYSRVNGPRERAVLHLQGCTLACAGCFNPGSHSINRGKLFSTDEVLNMFTAAKKQHVTISGGEPFQQWPAVKELLTQLKETGHKILVFTGYYKEELVELNYWDDAAALIDLLVSGRYDKSLPAVNHLLSSSNQTLYRFSATYSEE